MAHDLTLSHKIKTLTRTGKGEATKGKIKQYIADVVSLAVYCEESRMQYCNFYKEYHFNMLLLTKNPQI